MVRTEPIAEVVAIKKHEQIALEPLTLLPPAEDAKAELRRQSTDSEQSDPRLPTNPSFYTGRLAS